MAISTGKIQTAADLAELARRFLINEKTTDRLDFDLFELEERVEGAEAQTHSDLAKLRGQMHAAICAAASVAIAGDQLIRAENAILRTQIEADAAERAALRKQVEALTEGVSELVKDSAEQRRTVHHDYYEMLRFIGHAAKHGAAAALRVVADTTGTAFSEETLEEADSQLGFALIESARGLSRYAADGIASGAKPETDTTGNAAEAGSPSQSPPPDPFPADEKALQMNREAGPSTLTH